MVNLANIYWGWKVDEANGAKYYEQAIQMPKNNGIANAYYAGALLGHGKRDQAMIEAKKALAAGLHRQSRLQGAGPEQPVNQGIGKQKPSHLVIWCDGFFVSFSGRVRVLDKLK